MNKIYPKLKQSKNEKKQELKPWISKEILKDMKKEQKMNKKHIKFGIPDSEEHKKLKQFRNQINRRKKEAERKYFAEKSDKIDSQRKAWDLINEANKVPKRKHTIPESIEITDSNTHEISKTSSKPLIANKMNDYFASIASKLASELPSPTTDFKSYLPNPNPNDISLDHIEAKVGLLYI